MRTGARSRRGTMRQRNEDSFCLHDLCHRWGWVLAAVADGMGGHQGGDVASRLAIEVLSTVVGRELTAAAVPPGEILAGAFAEANRRILAAAGASPSRDGMGTTLTAALSRGGTLHLGHVGDSRAYLVRGQNITQLTQDHTLVGVMVRNGDLTEEEAMCHPQRNFLTRALGSDVAVTADLSCHRLEPGDSLLLCTDGLHGLVDRRDILAALVGADPRVAVEALVRLAVQRGGHDDVTVVILQPGNGGEAAR